MPLAEPDLLGLARQSLPLGEIRIGASQEIPGKKARKPVRLERFRFTTPNQDTAGAVAERYGGDPAPWDRRAGYWVVDTTVAKVDVWVPPRGLAVDTNMEMWGGSPVKCLRWCNGKIERRSGQRCMCPMPDDPTDPADVQRAYDERKRLAALGKACSVRTRYNLSIPELPGLVGVWKLLTGSANAARWSADSGEVLERARTARVFLPASLEITWWPGQDGHPYPVPILRPKQSAVQVAAGELPSGLDGLLAQLQTGQPGGGPLALTGGAPAETAQANAPDPGGSDDAEDDPEALAAAQRAADDAANATTREEVAAYAAQAKRDGLMGYLIRTPGVDDTHEDLHDYLDAQWRRLPAAQAAPAPRRQRRADGPQEAHAARPSASATSPADDDGSLFNDPNWADAEAGQ